MVCIVNESCHYFKLWQSSKQDPEVQWCTSILYSSEQQKRKRVFAKAECF